MPKGPSLNRQEKIEMVKSKQEAVRAEVHVVPAEGWVKTLKEIVRQKKIGTLLYAPETELGKSIKSRWSIEEKGLSQLEGYEGDIEVFKEKLFAIDASVTSTIGAIAETGALMLWPDTCEPRLMSLIPPIHIAVLKADDICDDFHDAMARWNWAQGMPTNALLISGPSKTADIELVLAFGVHGPKELVVLILE
jgi:L-lactate dehydrogenase complex protein LldG